MAKKKIEIVELQRGLFSIETEHLLGKSQNNEELGRLESSFLTTTAAIRESSLQTIETLDK